MKGQGETCLGPIHRFFNGEIGFSIIQRDASFGILEGARTIFGKKALESGGSRVSSGAFCLLLLLRSFA